MQNQNKPAPSALQLAPEHADKLASLATRSEKRQRWAAARRPKAIGDVLAQLIAKRGYGAVETNKQLEEIWAAAAGRFAAGSRAVRLSRGRLEVLVAHSTLVQEMTFDKQRLLAAVRGAMPEAQISDIKFRVGKLT